MVFAELYSIVGKPNIFSYSYGDLRSATDNFSSSNLLGEGGYGSVYKVSHLQCAHAFEFSVNFFTQQISNEQQIGFIVQNWLGIFFSSALLWVVQIAFLSLKLITSPVLLLIYQHIQIRCIL